jgi:tRNA threonylcarbamoyladenosine biosynthesis protein TsaB
MTMAPDPGGARLVMDTATDRTVLALRPAPGASIRDGSAAAPERGAAALGVRLDALLREARVEPRTLRAIGVGTGPGSFTGLRVGLATAKTLAWSLRVPLVGIPTVDALRRAAAPDGMDPAAIAVIQAAGARDHYLALPDTAPRLVPPGTDLAAEVAGQPAIALGTDATRLVGVRGPDGGDPASAGERARAGMGAALMALLDLRLAADEAGDDAAGLVPVYVALPRGIALAVTAGWTPELR